jgi:hypothetical protein
MDPFSRGLDDLGTFPDRAKIEGLVMVAEDAAGDTAALAALADAALTKLALAAPAAKLPLLYVIDAVGKNRTVGPSFQAALGSRLVSTVLGAASQVRRRRRRRRG